MNYVDLEMILEGGGALTLTEMDEATARQVQELFRKYLSMQAEPMGEIRMPRGDGKVDEFIIDFRKVALMLVKGTSSG